MNSWLRRWVMVASLGMIASTAVIAAPTASGADAQAIRAQQLEREWREAVMARLQQSSHARDRLLAAMLLPRAADGSQDEATRAALLRDAMANAGDDALVWWIAANECPASPAVCNASHARVRLRELAPDNAAVWWLGLQVSRAADGTVTVLAADLALDAHLQGAATATHYDPYFDDLLRSLVQAQLAVPMPPTLIAAMDPEPLGLAPTPTRLAFIHALGLTMAVAMPSYATIPGLCESAEPTRHRTCLRALRIQAKAGDLASAGIASALLLRLLPPGAERDALIAKRRERAWQQAAWLELNMPAGIRGPLDADQTDCLIAERLAPGGSEFRAIRACLNAAGVALTPPPGWVFGNGEERAPAPN